MAGLEPSRRRRGRAPGVGSLMNLFDRDLDDFFNMRPDLTESFLANELMLACDISETEDAYLMSMDLPGVAKDDIDIDVSGNQLTVRAERSSEREEGDGKGRTTYTERRYGKMERSFMLPEHIDPEKVEASYENGVLTLTIPKGEARRKKIQVQERGGLLGKAMPGKGKEAKEEVEVNKKM